MDNDYQAGQSEKEWRDQYLAEDLDYQKMSSQVLSTDFNFHALELIHVGPGPKYYSRLGHVILRFTGSGKNPEEDLTLSFMIDADEYVIDNWKGFWGGRYRIYPLIKTLKDQKRHYTQEEKRTFIRYELHLPIKDSFIIKEKLKTLLRSYIQNREQLGTWSMLDNNCTSMLNNYLVDAGFTTPYKKRREMIWPEWFVNNYLKFKLLSRIQEGPNEKS